MKLHTPRPATARPARFVTPEAAAPVALTAGPQLAGTGLFLIGLVTTWFFLGGKLPSDIARAGSIGVGLSILASAWVDLRLGFRNLVRTDLMAILALYFLTLFEFLFPQGGFDALNTLGPTHDAVVACLWGFGGLAIGRHLLRLRKQPLAYLVITPVPRSWLLFVFWSCVVLSYFHMALAVDFDLVKMVLWFMEPRFSQPWQRGQLGGWKDLLNEFAMLLNLIPPLAGIMIARRRKFTAFQLLLVWLGFLLTLFYGFSGGTRNVFAIYLITFLIGYAFALPEGHIIELGLASILCAALLLVSNSLMLQFRNIGLEAYLRGEREPQTFQQEKHELTIDNDLYAICRLVEYFPKSHDFLGWEVPYLAVIRPVPRALWPGKPVGMSFSVENVFNAEGYTIASSVVGEAFMTGGNPGVFLICIFFGALMGWWNHVASAKNSELGILIYASGFFSAVITMRSFSVFTTTVLPTVAAVVAGTLVLKRRRANLERQAADRLRLAPRTGPGPKPARGG